MKSAASYEFVNAVVIIALCVISTVIELDRMSLLVGCAFSIVNLRFYLCLSESIINSTNLGIIVGLLALKLCSLLFILYIMSKLTMIGLLSGVLGIFSFIPAVLFVAFQGLGSQPEALSSN